MVEWGAGGYVWRCCWRYLVMRGGASWHDVPFQVWLPTQNHWGDVKYSGMVMGGELLVGWWGGGERPGGMPAGTGGLEWQPCKCLLLTFMLLPCTHSYIDIGMQERCEGFDRRGR